MDMRCDSVDIATFLGDYGTAATRVNRQRDRTDEIQTEFKLESSLNPTDEISLIDQ